MRQNSIRHYKEEVKFHIIKAGIPKVHFSGTEGDYNVMVMDLLGPSLEELFIYGKKTFTLKTVLMVGEQTVVLKNKCSLRESNLFMMAL